MSLIFRKSKKLGPFNVSASKRGLSASIGGRAVRLTKGAGKQDLRLTLTLPGTGIRYTGKIADWSSGVPVRAPSDGQPIAQAMSEHFSDWTVDGRFGPEGPPYIPVEE